MSKAQPALDQLPDRAADGSGDQSHQPQLSFNRVGLPLDVGQAAVVLP